MGEVVGAHVVHAYSSMGLVMDLLVCISVSLFFPMMCLSVLCKFLWSCNFCFGLFYMFGEGEFGA